MRERVTVCSQRRTSVSRGKHEIVTIQLCLVFLFVSFIDTVPAVREYRPLDINELSATVTKL